MITRFHFQKQTTLSDRNLLKNFLKKICKREKCKIATIDFVFCTDKYLLSINQSFLQHDDYTDIITFDLTPKGETSITAEIYISTERVKENATLYSSTVKRELHRVIFHGILHLCGYKDKKPAQQTIMRMKEEEYLNLYFKS